MAVVASASALVSVLALEWASALEQASVLASEPEWAPEWASGLASGLASAPGLVAVAAACTGPA